jgi:hypothetical protein
MHFPRQCILNARPLAGPTAEVFPDNSLTAMTFHHSPMTSTDEAGPSAPDVPGAARAAPAPTACNQEECCGAPRFDSDILPSPALRPVAPHNEGAGRMLKFPHDADGAQPPHASWKPCSMAEGCRLGDRPAPGRGCCRYWVEAILAPA